ncbi:hypothetical protein AYO20_08199 [Fonsecaea nubica]|uniref:Uncharacterized protein n=2 Tax=Fonsecaea TaxID=40354 RepID=A0A0D2H051_9EURO|nr:uncharacterized protein Z517_03515 [Fonsecaea pedrosoi CBS 271.37]XP_022497603.1 hypothetical protein AYO20_08199 [Fonsecaea nubica]KIW84265.1 hypothetical protein Z517_03515 [Fonsecaea pedrosoi CBS 271.37]OAL31656.1 hypothetical protein AYO20_08199 [Fonsecaea nubica]
MTRAADPYYNRKPVPDELVKDVGLTGLTPEEEYWNREKKFTAHGADVRRFSNSLKGGIEPLNDPYYGRKPVSKAEIANVGFTGLSPEEEYWNRERKYSATGVDVRKFSSSKKGGLSPQDDPYYGRRRVSAAEIANVAPLDAHMTPAEQYEVRERKQSLFQLSSDPFDIMANRNRQSISGATTGASAAATRRRSSAVAPDAAAAASHSGYHGEKLAPIESRPEGPPATSNIEAGSGHTSDTLSRDSIDPAEGSHARTYDAVTAGHNHPVDPDSVAPHELR